MGVLEDQVTYMPILWVSLKYFPLFSSQHNDDSCGLHVHVNKSAFEGDIHLYKFIDFINNNNTFH